MRAAARRGRGSRGFSLAEMSVILAVIGCLFALSLPSFVTYYRTSQVRGAASDMAAYLNQGRQLAIQRNQSVCVNITGAAVQYLLGGCGGAAWLGSGTDAAGNIAAPSEVTLTTTANPVFNNLGAANPGATLTVTQGTYTLSVTVSASGRVSVGP